LFKPREDLARCRTVLAFCTKSKYLEGSALRLEVLLPANLGLDQNNFVVDKLSDFSAIQTNEVIVVGPAEDFFKPGMVLGKAVLGDKPTLQKQIESVVDCGARDLVPMSFHLQEKFVCIEMSSAAQHCVEDHEPLRRYSVSASFQEVTEGLFRRVGGQGLSRFSLNKNNKRSGECQAISCEDKTSLLVGVLPFVGACTRGLEGSSSIPPISAVTPIH